MNITPRSRSEAIIVQEAGNELLVYDLNEHRAYCLNEVSAAVWKSCDGHRDIKEITRSAGNDYGATLDEDLIVLALDQLRRAELVDDAPKLADRFPAVSRREIIRRIGKASLVALPVLTSLVAPTAIHANSLCMTLVGGCTCGLGDNQPSGMFCVPSGFGAMACADTNCRCLSMGFGADDCVP